jgi:trk system potassium uptake protein TrkA
MKRFLVIGLGNFGSTISARLFKLGHDVIAVDKEVDVIDAIGSRVSRAMAGDATNRRVLEEIGVRDCDAAIISTGDDVAASVLALLAVKDVGVKEIYVKVISNDHKRIADAIGATETIFPEKEVAEGLASRLTDANLLRYLPYSDEFGIQEMAVPDAWSGKTLRELSLRERFGVQVVAIHDMLTDTMGMSTPDKPLTASDTLLVAGSPQALAKLGKPR